MMSKKGKLDQIASMMKRKRAETKRNPLWGKPGYCMGLRELRELFSTLDPPESNFPPGATDEDKIRILKEEIAMYQTQGDAKLNWQEESTYYGQVVK